jgi:DNA-binding Lrp family transcriptional regulator
MQELQKDLPLTPTPFTDIARQFQIEEVELLQFLAYLKTSRKMSRFAAILYHRNIGYHANVMVVWDVPEDTVQAFGEYAAEQREISHCYERVTYPEWPYNFYTMIHGRTHELTQQVIDALAEEFQITSYERLESGKEFKKQPVNYFNDDITRWHQKWVEGKAV